MSHKLFEVLRKLEQNKVHYSLSKNRPDAVQLSCTLVSARIEIDVFEDGHVEFSHFSGNEDVLADEQALWRLVTKLA